MDQRVSDERREETAPNRDATQARGEAPEKKSFLDRLRQHRRLVLALTAICILIGVGIIVWWVNSSCYISTDDAFIDARTVTISSQINAQVANVPVTDNQLVK